MSKPVGLLGICCGPPHDQAKATSDKLVSSPLSERREGLISGRVGPLTMDIESEKCQICGRPAKNYQFAAFVCDREECVEEAMRERGGPAGHIKAKREAEERSKEK